MCRFILYKGQDPILIADLITRPAHSIITQSFDCKLRLDSRRPLNGDGFGLGWYESNDPDPCIFTSVLPAWNNMNLHRLAEKIRSPLLFAHVRASTGGTPASESNCHPWQFGSLMWMHNGHIAEFNKIKRSLQNQLKEEYFLHIQGNTDSEWAFALFLNQLNNTNKLHYTPQELREAMFKTIALIDELSAEAGITASSLLNFAVTDGRTVVCTRYNSSEGEPAASLYYSSGTRFERYGNCRYKMVKADKREHMVVIASEPLTFEEADWLPIPNNHLVVITPKLNVLRYPIPTRPTTVEV
ncbi:glutamine amidotransferase subunit [Entomophthora muscae]|uniref:Glutamine amidotransferase subunit n=1 Tax=Entomophthora muscae TaxID=34485 RepID=A0ACC2RX54_9FUNG|nr:glutamine amidotransferase subunit [Entomophthora muscae]